MKSFISISLVLLFFIQSLVPGMDLCCEVTKLPALYEHYDEHVAHDGITFIDFLSLHYGNDENSIAHHHDDEHDEELPLHGEHKCHHAPMHYCTLDLQYKISNLVFPNGIAQSQYHFSLTSRFADTPFQPPRA